MAFATDRSEPAAAPRASGALDQGGAKRAWRVWLLAGAAGLFAWLVLAAWTPPEDPAWTTCLFKRVTQRDCPSCGVTRSLSLLAHGELGGSLERHPLAGALAAEAVLLWLLAPLALRRGWRPSESLVTRWAVANLVALFVAWAVRLVGLSQSI